ncbi:hypothetical protein Salat_0688200 [Sesamum alatum]|uniref:Uncharacterized protein n=1 Tax=Sesamum alatum TaxID=300844 RepID=A0AAE1YS50_9LAMI|nr:hypothetical protein Salat_0688200 [Sesamum alatum]
MSIYVEVVQGVEGAGEGLEVDAVGEGAEGGLDDDEGGELVDSEFDEDVEDNNEQMGNESVQIEDQMIGKRKAPEPTTDGAINTNERERESSGTQAAMMYPPLPSQCAEEEEFEPCITQQMPSQATNIPIYKPGPSMYQQLQQSNTHLNPRVQIRAPPPMIGIHGVPIFSTTPRTQADINPHPIITDGEQKYLDLSQISSTD